MATSMIFSILSKNVIKLNTCGRHEAIYGKAVRAFASLPSQQDSETPAMQFEAEKSESLYPPIKPEFPPGKWGGLNSHSAWLMHNTAQTLLKIPTAKLRLAYLEGDEPYAVWMVDPFLEKPRNLDFRRYITRTHLINGLPDVYKNIPDAEGIYNAVKSDISEIVAQELWQTEKTKIEPNYDGAVFVDAKKYVTHRMIGGVLRYLRAYLSRSSGHLLRSQIDENVRVESFWNVTGFKEKCRGKYKLVYDEKGENAGVVKFQYKHKPSWQLRTELPLSEIVPVNDGLCKLQPLPSIDYAPAAASMPAVKDRFTSISGHWIGAPCEWTSLSIHVLPTAALESTNQLGPHHLTEAELAFGLTAGFGSCVAQAHNQGFCHVLDLTYPISTQCLVTDGNTLRVFCYQLNTLQLWKEYSERGNPVCNLVWVSDALPLFLTATKEATEADRKPTLDVKVNKNTRSLNPEAFKMLINCLLLEPKAKPGVDLRPYLSRDSGVEDSSIPVEVKKYINHKGEEPIRREKIGRFQYPKNSTYFLS